MGLPLVLPVLLAILAATWMAQLTALAAEAEVEALEKFPLEVAEEMAVSMEQAGAGLGAIQLGRLLEDREPQASLF